MSYTFPNRRTQITNLVVHQSATLDQGGTATWGTVTGDLTVGGNIVIGGIVLGQEGRFSNVTASNTIAANVLFGNSVLGREAEFANVLVENDIGVGNNMYVAGTASFGDTTIEGDMRLKGNVYISPDTTFYGNVVLQGNLSVSNLISALQDIYVYRNLRVDGLSNLASIDVHSTAVMSSLRVLSNLAAQYINVYNINTTNCYFLKGNVFTDSLTTLRLLPGANIILNGGSIYGVKDMSVSNAYFQNGNVFTGGGTVVDWNSVPSFRMMSSSNVIDLNGAEIRNGTINVSNLTVQQKLDAIGTLNVTGSTTLSDLLIQQTADISNLIVQGTSRLHGNVTASSNLLVEIDATINGLLKSAGFQTLSIDLIPGGSDGTVTNLTPDDEVTAGNFTTIAVANTNPGTHLLAIGLNVYIDDGVMAFRDAISLEDFTGTRNATVGDVLGAESVFVKDAANDVVYVGNTDVRVGVLAGAFPPLARQTIAVGYVTGSNQQSNAVAIGTYAGASQGESSIAVGQQSGVSQNAYAVAIGTSAGLNQSDNAVALGKDAGYSQDLNAIAVGENAGGAQSIGSIAIGKYAGATQLSESIAIGTFAGSSQSDNAVAIGQGAGFVQGSGAIAIGQGAGNAQAATAIALGKSSGITQLGDAIAIGTFAGINQGVNTVALGQGAGFTQNAYAIAIGQASGYQQDEGAIAIGTGTGNVQGKNSILIGTNTSLVTHPGAIVLNANGGNLSSQTSNAFYVNPVREVTESAVALGYTSNKEIVQAKNLKVPGHLSAVVTTTTVTSMSSNVTVSASVVSDVCGRFEVNATGGNALDLITMNPPLYGIANVHFESTYTNTPVVIITPTNYYSSNVSVFVQPNPGYFEVVTTMDTLPVAQPLKFNYIVMGING